MAGRLVTDVDFFMMACAEMEQAADSQMEHTKDELVWLANRLTTPGGGGGQPKVNRLLKGLPPLLTSLTSCGICELFRPTKDRWEVDYR